MCLISYITKGGCYFLLANPDDSFNHELDWSPAINMLGQFFFLAAVFALIIFMAVYMLKFAGRFRNYAGGNSNLRVVESRSLGAQNFVHLVKIGDRYIVVGTSKESVSFLTEAEAESITDIYENNSDSGFERHILKQIDRLKKRKEKPEE